MRPTRRARGSRGHSRGGMEERRIGCRTRTGMRRRVRHLLAVPFVVLAAATAATTSAVVTATSASAHEADATLISRLEDVRPHLPDGVVVQVRASIATQL